MFGCFSCGAYHASDSIVVKFCSTDNETKKEQTLLAAADILELFVPTFFHRLPVTQLDDTNSSRYTYDSHYHTWCKDPSVDDFELNYLEIQPMLLMKILEAPKKLLSPTFPWPYSNQQFDLAEVYCWELWWRVLRKVRYLLWRLAYLGSAWR